MAQSFRQLPIPGKIAFLSAVILVVAALGEQNALLSIALLILGGAILCWIILIAFRWTRPAMGRSRNPSQAIVSGEAVRRALHESSTSAGWEPTLSRTVHTPRIGDVLALPPGQFEDMTGALVSSLGYTEVRRSGGSGDFGVDLYGRDPQGRTTIVQCKRYAPGSTIGTPVVQTFIGMMTVHHRAERGVIVSTVSFTQPAVDLARHPGIALIDGNSLVLLLHLTGIPLYRHVGV